MKGKNKNSSAFTLIELLVVIAIIGLLASIVMVATKETRAKAKDVRRVEDLKQFQSALEMYYSQHGEYPGEPGHYYTNNGGNTWYMRCCPATYDQNDQRLVKFYADLAPYMSTLVKAIPQNRAVYTASDGSCQTANYTGVQLIQYRTISSQRYKLSTRLETDCDKVANDGGTSTCCPIINASSKGRSYEVYELFNDSVDAGTIPTY